MNDLGFTVTGAFEGLFFSFIFGMFFGAIITLFQSFARVSKR